MSQPSGKSVTPLSLLRIETAFCRNYPPKKCRRNSCVWCKWKLEHSRHSHHPHCFDSDPGMFTGTYLLYVYPMVSLNLCNDNNHFGHSIPSSNQLHNFELNTCKAHNKAHIDTGECIKSYALVQLETSETVHCLLHHRFRDQLPSIDRNRIKDLCVCNTIDCCYHHQDVNVTYQKMLMANVKWVHQSKISIRSLSRLLIIIFSSLGPTLGAPQVAEYKEFN